MEKYKKIARIFDILIIVELLITVGFFVYTACIGGYALDGYAEDGVYFVSSLESVTEVSRAEYVISIVWSIVFLVTFPLSIIGAFIITCNPPEVWKRRRK